VSADLEPPELARLADVAGAARVDDWTLRSALTRYAQPQPARAAAILEPYRRLEAALHPHAALLRADGPALLAEVESGTDAGAGAGAGAGPVASGEADADRALVVGLLGVARIFDALADRLTEWATDITAERPDDAVDDAMTEAKSRLDALGVPEEEERQRPPRGRG
jgi:hypothetical protein